MACPLSFEGWFRYTNTGRIYRKWEVASAKDGAEVQCGDEIQDRGPGLDPRITVYRNGDKIRSVDSEEAEDFFGSVSQASLPTWDPPTGVDLELIQWIEWLGKQVQRLSVHSRSRSSNLPDQLRQFADRVDPDTCDGPLVGALQLVREGSYSNTGSSFRVWRFIEDRTEIPAPDHRRTGGPAHAQEGDELWQEPDRLTPWKLKRDQVQVGAPEDWQLRGAFGGSIPGWGEEWQQDVTEDEAGRPSTAGGRRHGPHPDLYRYVSRETVDGRPVEMDSETNPYVKANRRGIYRFDCDVPAIAAEAGDVLVLAYLRESRPAKVHGRLYGLTVEDTRRLRAFLDGQGVPRKEAILEAFTCLSGSERELVGEPGRHHWRKHGLLLHLDHQTRWGGRLKDFYSRLLLLKPACRPEPVSQPIEATSDAAAAFELLAQLSD